MNIQWPDIRFFKAAEFDTRDSKGVKIPQTGERNMKLSFVKRLDRMRYIVNEAMGINSGYRSPEHNASVGETGESGPHTTGQASDIGIKDSHTMHKMLHAAALVAVVEAGYLSEEEAKLCLADIIKKGYGFKGLGIGKTFLHLDDLTEAVDKKFAVRPNVWTY